MVAATKCKLAIVLLLGCTACAAPVGAMRAEAPSSASNTEVLKLARERMQEAFSKLEDKIRECDENLRMRTVVPPNAIPKLPLSEREWGTALLYLSNQATARCEGEAWGEALLAYARFRDFEKQITGRNATDTSPYDLPMLCCIGQFAALETEVAYRELDPDIRQKLEMVPDLNRPFNPIKTFEAMQKTRTKNDRAYRTLNLQ